MTSKKYVIIGLGAILCALFFTKPFTTFAAAPTGTSAVLQNTTSSTMDIVVTGTNFVSFVSSGTTTANGTDRAKITWRTLNPNTAIINNATTMTLTFTNAYGTDINGNSLTIAADAVQDGSAVHNALITIGSGSITDNAAPTVFTLLNYYADANRDGTVDGLYLSFTEPVTCAFESGDWAITTAGTINVTAINGCSNYTSTSILLAVTTTSGITGGGTNPQVSYTNQGTLASVKDSANNAFASTSGIAPGDAAAPQIKSFTYLDNDGDGKIDQLTLAYTETVAAGAVLRAADLAFSNVGDFTGAAFGSDTTDLITGSVTQTTITLGTEATAIDTYNSGSIAINSQNNFSLTDGFNTNNTLRTQSQASFIDGAAPVYISSKTIDNNQNGTIDHIRVVYSEPLSDASVTPSDYAAGFSGVGAGALVESFGSGTPGSGVFTDVANDEVIYVGVTSGTDVIAPNKTDYTLHIAQVGSVTDSIGNALASFSEKTSTDGAAPALYTNTVISSPTTNTAPTIIFSIIEDATLSYTGGCTMPLTNVVAGAYSQAFNVLTDGTYSCSIRGTDALGNISAALTINTFTVDTAAPLLSSASAGQSAGSITITWTTDEPASSSVSYGTTTAYGNSTGEADTSPRVTSHAVSISGLVLCRDYHLRPTSRDGAGNEITGPDIALSNLGNCGVALPVGALAGPIVPEGGFKISFKEGVVVSAPTVTLLFNAGNDVTQVALSNSSDFSQAVLEAYQPTRVWNVCQKSAADVTTTTCKPGTYAVYAKFYTKWGRSSDVVTASVTLEESAFSSNSLVQDGNTIYLILGGKKYGFTSLAAFRGLGYTTKRVVRAKTASVPLGGLIKSASSAHLSGSWIVQNKTVYFVTDAGRIPVPTWDIFLGNGGSAVALLPANAADMATSLLSAMTANDVRVTK